MSSQRNVRPSTQANLVLCCSGTSAGPPPDCHRLACPAREASSARSAQAAAGLVRRRPPPPSRPFYPAFFTQQCVVTMAAHDNLRSRILYDDIIQRSDCCSSVSKSEKTGCSGKSRILVSPKLNSLCNSCSHHHHHNGKH